MNFRHKASKILSAIIVSAALLSITTAQANEEDKVLNVYSWSGYIADDTIPNFEKKYGIKVTLDTFDSSEILHAKLVSGRSGYDVVMTSSGWGRMQSEGGLLKPLDKNLIPNYKNLDPVIQAIIAKQDVGNTYLTSWLWGYDTVVINSAKVKAALGDTPMPMNSWDLIFNPVYASKLAKCGISVLDGASEVIPVALLYMGKPTDSSNPEDYAAVQSMLMKVRPYIKLFSSSGYAEDMINGNLCVAMGWSGDISVAIQRAKDYKRDVILEHVMPKSGGLMFFDTMAIPADAPHSKNAHLWINYILSPEVHASLTNKSKYANANLHAKPYVKPELANDKTIYPDKDDLNRMGAQGKVNNQIRKLMNKTYTIVKTGL
jgi:putrescine transport system substrate-binding protein